MKYTLYMSEKAVIKAGTVFILFDRGGAMIKPRRHNYINGCCLDATQKMLEITVHRLCVCCKSVSPLNKPTDLALI